MIQIGPITLDFTPLLDAAAQSPLAAMWYLFVNGGWILILYVLFKGGGWYYMNTIQHAYEHQWKFVLLAIDVPKDNEQTPKAVENLFTYIAGAHGSINIVEKYFGGKTQETFSFEIASHEGNVRFYVRTPVQYRDLVEAGVFSQYPDAQINEVEDYVSIAPNDYPNEEWDFWGTEFKLGKPDSYPIRTYPAFEHQLSQDFMDPMATLLEGMNKLGPDEHLWMQILIKPISQDWTEKGVKLSKKLVGAKVEHETTLAQKAIGLPSDLLIKMLPELLGPGEHDEKQKNELTNLMLYLTPGERTALEALQFKISKLGFKTKIRMLYLGKKEVFSKSLGLGAMFGAMKQFNALDQNDFKPDKSVWTKANYILVKPRVARRQRNLMRAYKGRSMHAGGREYILNIEELATIWHFPVISVKAPSVAKTEAKRMQPPTGLPVSRGVARSIPLVRSKDEEEPNRSDEGPPENLPTE